MGELRKDYILDKYVYVATERSKRPKDFKHTPRKENYNAKCFFCPGNEHLTPPEIYRVEKDKNVGWTVRVFPNKFPAVSPKGKSELITDNDFFTYADSFGYHEVVAETRYHNLQLWDLSKEDFVDILKTFVLRYNDLKSRERIKYVSIFKNFGENGGASLHHSHSQIIATSIVPPLIKEREKVVEKYDSCPYCRIIEIEKNSERRCYENETFVAFTPYASLFNFEVWIFPKRHVVEISELNEKELDDFADAYKYILDRLKEIDPDYNVCFVNGTGKVHFHIEIKPRIAKWAGFEHLGGIVINSVSPEQAARFYRNESEN